MLPPFPPKAPVHFNVGAWALAVVADERWVERGALLSDAGDYGCVSQKLGVLSLPLHSFGNKLLFWPRRLWARAVAALAGKLWEEDRRWQREAGGTDAEPKTSGRRPPGSGSAPPAQPFLTRPSPEGVPAATPPQPPAAPPPPAQSVFSRTEGGRRAEAGSSSLPARQDPRAQG